MTFLKKFGMVVAGILGVAQVFAPAFGAAVPGGGAVVAQIEDTLGRIYGVVLAVEATGASLNLSGPQKLAAASAQVAQVILASAFLAHHEIGDPDKFKVAVQTITSGVADLLNSLKDKVDVSKIS